MVYVSVIPAYGRDYKSVREVKAAWDAGQDFMICGAGPDSGRYVNKPQTLPSQTYNVRYLNQTRVCSIRGGA